MSLRLHAQRFSNPARLQRLAVGASTVATPLCTRNLTFLAKPASAATSFQHNKTFSTPQHRRSFHESAVSKQGGMPPPRGGGGGGPGQPIGNIFGNQKKAGETLAEVGIDLTQLAAEGKLDPVIGRDAEIKRMIQILSRRTKSNPVLIAPAGVGKTAIVEGLAQRIHTKEVPESLHGKRVISVDLAGLVAGSAFRGSFEEKFKSLLSDIDAAAGNCIIFVDELHNLMNLGKAEGSVTGSEIIKPALARGLQLAGASTLDEYRKTIEKDAALARRFQPIIVQEPTVEQTSGFECLIQRCATVS